MPSELQIDVKTLEEQNALQEYKGLSSLVHLQALIECGKSIVVSSPSEIELITQAREVRLELKRIRATIENKRKELKENIVLRGKAIDGMANIFKDMIVPVERHLEDQEKYAERLEENRLNKLAETRKVALAPYLEDYEKYTCCDLKSMSEQGFAQLLQSSKIAFEAKRESALKAEAERLAREKEEAIERERIREENKILKREQIEREKAEAERRKEETAKLEAERKAKENAEAEVRAVKEEQARKEREETERKLAKEREEKETEEKAKRAPDKEKLNQFALTIARLQVPFVKSNKAKLILAETLEELNKTMILLKTKTAML